jgi:6-pyruvoyltetrahydropterin/6-carboxytetrahydropterin synthase
MHKLSRQIRFSVNPFLTETPTGDNSYSSKPCGEGLALFFALWVELQAQVDPDTGFVVNVVEIDKVIRKSVIGVFADFVTDRFRQAKHISLPDTCKLLEQTWPVINNQFGNAQLTKLGLQLNPSRKISIQIGNQTMTYFSEKFEFAAMHKLWNKSFTDEKNFEVFGKCANPSGHGHNYVIEVTIEKQNIDDTFKIGTFEELVSKEFIDLVDHKNLNEDVPEFAETIPTVENIAVFAWEMLSEKIGPARLSNVTVWESDRTSCTYCG